MRRMLVGAMVAMLLAMAPPSAGAAEGFASPSFEALWALTDAEVASGAVNRAWVWGPGPISPARQEPYAESPGGQRLVQYFDKGRMELNRPDGPVTAGLLARDLMTGLIATGDRRVEQRPPADLGVVGDPGDTLGPTYALLGRVMSRPPEEEGTPVVQVLNRDGSIGADLVFSRHGIINDILIPETGHRLPNVFRAYFEGRPLPLTTNVVEAAPFAPWYTVTGLPLTEAYWTRARVGTITRDVLVQAFERRVLTYTPDNPIGSKVEMGNVGQHYLAWLSAPAAPAEPAGLPCPAIPDIPAAKKGESPHVITGSTLHTINGRHYVSGSVRNDGSSSQELQVTVRGFNILGREVGRGVGFTDRTFWPGGQFAGFQIELPTSEPPTDWRVDVRPIAGVAEGGLSGAFTIEGLTGSVDGLGLGQVSGRLRYTGREPFRNVVLVRVHGVDACGSLITTGFSPVGSGTTPVQPGEVTDFSLLLLRAEGVISLRAVVEARYGEGSRVDDDALIVYRAGVFPAPRMPIVASDGCCIYTRAYRRPDGAPVSATYRRRAGG